MNCRKMMLMAALAFVAPEGTLAQQQGFIAGEWLTYRGGIFRQGNQANTGSMAPIGNPSLVPTLHALWTFPNASNCGTGFSCSNGSVCPIHSNACPALEGFVASPVVSNGIAYIGNVNGEFYAINMTDGSLKWMFPNPTKQPPLNGRCTLGQYGITASAVIDTINGEPVVIFAAPDPEPATDGGNGSARLWALDANTGSLIWKSDVVARISGCTRGAYPPNTYFSSSSPPSGPEYHEMVRHSAPLVLHTSPPPPENPVAGMYTSGRQATKTPFK